MSGARCPVCGATGHDTADMGGIVIIGCPMLTHGDRWVFGSARSWSDNAAPRPLTYEDCVEGGEAMARDAGFGLGATDSAATADKPDSAASTR